MTFLENHFVDQLVSVVAQVVAVEVRKVLRENRAHPAHKGHRENAVVHVNPWER